MTMRIKYFNRGTGLMIEKDIPSDVCTVIIPPQEGQPALEVTVNTDAVLVDVSSDAPEQDLPGKRIGGLTYIDLVTDAKSETTPKTIKVRCFKIKWDTDGASLKSCGLPKETTVETDFHEDELEYHIADVLSDKYGYCVKSCEYQVLPES